MSHNALERPLDVVALLDVHEELVVVKSPTGLPPGSRVTFFVNPESVGEPIQLRGKIAGISKTPDGAYRLTVKLHSLSKADKYTLQKFA